MHGRVPVRLGCSWNREHFSFWTCRFLIAPRSCGRPAVVARMASAPCLLSLPGMSRCLTLIIASSLALAGRTVEAQAPAPATPPASTAAPAPAATADAPTRTGEVAAVRAPARATTTPTQPEYRIGSGDKL